MLIRLYAQGDQQNDLLLFMIKLYKKTQHINLTNFHFVLHSGLQMSDDEEAYLSSDASVSEEEEETLFNDTSSSTKQEYNTLIDARSLQRRVRDLDAEQSQGVFIMTKYEYTRVKGERLQQLNSGGIPYVPYTTKEDTIESIFQREFATGRLPLLVERKTPDGHYQFIKIRQFSNRDTVICE